MNAMKLQFIFYILLMCGCTSREYRSLSIGNPELITDFEVSPPLEEISDFLCEEIGINSVKIVDSLLVIGHGKNWTLVNQNDGHKVDILSAGEGPEEFYSVPRCSSAAFIEVDDSLFAFVQDKTKGRIMKLNISEALSGGKIIPSPYIENSILNNELWDVIVCDSTTFWMSVPNDSFTGFRREIWESDSIYEPEVTKGISTSTVNDNINLLSKVTRYNKSADKFVEGMVYLNQLNIYSKDGKYGKTICVGDRLDNLDDIEATFRANLKNTYNSVSAWNFGFGAAFSGHSDREIGSKRGNESEIQFFSWNGTPIYRIKFPFEVLAFDLDPVKRMLYVIDAEKDVLRKFDANPIMMSFSL